MTPPPTGSIPPSPAERRPVTWSGLIESAGAFGILATLAGFLASLHWVFDLMSNFRVQLAVATTLVALASLPSGRRIRSGLLLLCALVNIATVLWIARPAGRSPMPSDARIRVLSINVLSSNRRHDLVIEQIRRTDADLVLLMEVDRRWMDALAPLHNRYSNSVSEVREDNFGIALLSRLPLRDAQVVVLDGSEVPSLSAEVALGDRTLHLLGTHPVPPGSPDGARERNRQLDSIAGWAASRSGPVAVLGDLNSTPWSPHFSRLLDAGHLIRAHPDWGVFPTWQVHQPLLRLPLDHCLVSPDIAVMRLETGPDIGSDHRALRVDLAIPPSSMVSTRP